MICIDLNSGIEATNDCLIFSFVSLKCVVLFSCLHEAGKTLCGEVVGLAYPERRGPA